MTNRPISITLLAALLILVGAFGLVSHGLDFRNHQLRPEEFAPIAALSILATVAGVYLLRRRNWARWLAIAWIAAHVVISAFNSPFELLVHLGVCGVFAYILFRPPANRYFRP